MKNKKKKKSFEIKRSVKDFIKDEDGFITKENILKIGLGTITALGLIGALSNSYAGHSSSHGSHASHNNSGALQNVNYLTTEWVAGTNCYRIAVNHTSHAAHTSHPSHASTHASHPSY